MANVVVFDLATRNAVRGVSPTNGVCVLEPIAMTDGRFYVGTEVLVDVVFATAKYASLKLITPVDFETIRALTFQTTKGVATP